MVCETQHRESEGREQWGGEPSEPFSSSARCFQARLIASSSLPLATCHRVEQCLTVDVAAIPRAVGVRRVRVASCSEAAQLSSAFASAERTIRIGSDARLVAACAAPLTGRQVVMLNERSGQEGGQLVLSTHGRRTTQPLAILRRSRLSLSLSSHNSPRLHCFLCS